jgi:ElaB/YqjD/DUF883 family membrane-anchored ribosome-binding protein
VMQAKTKIDSARAMAVEQAGQAMQATEGYVRQEPLKAVAIAAAVGALIGLLIARS